MARGFPIVLAIVFLGCLSAISIAKEEEVDPDEIVAYGAPKLGAYNFSGERSDDEEAKVTNSRLLLFGTQSFGVGTTGGVMTELIPAEIILPVKMSQVFTTHKDNQTRVTIGVYQGESRLTKACKLLGKFDLTGIPPAPRGIPRIEVTFQMDARSNLNVKAEEKGTGKSEKITIPNVLDLLSQEESDRRIREAEELHKEAEKMKDRIDTFDSLETYVFNMANQFYDDKLADKLESDEKEKIEIAVKEATEWLAINQNTKNEDYEHKRKEVEAVFNPIITAVQERYRDFYIGDQNSFEEICSKKK